MPQNDSTQRNWLKENSSLRMDANIDVFPEERRSFHLARYEFAKAWCSDRKVLDGACGTGYGSNILSETAKEVTGIDCASEAVAYAKNTYIKENLDFQVSFVEATSFPSDTFDLVVSFETVEHTLCPESHIMEIVRLLDPIAGQTIISVPNNWGLTDHHFFDFNMEKLVKLISPYFNEIVFYYQNPTSHKSHPGIEILVPTETNDAQCILAVCSKPIKREVQENRYSFIMNEIYKAAFERHHEYQTLAYQQNTKLITRVLNKLKKIIFG